MKALIQAFILAILLLIPVLLIPAPESGALPVLNSGGTRCQCRCVGTNDGKDLDWKMTQSCSLSEGKSCTFNNGNGFKSGKLQSCQECRAGSSNTEWLCGAASISRNPTGTAQRTPAQSTLPKAAVKKD